LLRLLDHLAQCPSSHRNDNAVGNRPCEEAHIDTSLCEFCTAICGTNKSYCNLR